MTRKNAPRCVFCNRDENVQFQIFSPRFEPFGTACVECEAALPEGTTLPGDCQPKVERLDLFRQQHLIPGTTRRTS